MTNARRTFISTPATRIVSFLRQALVRERAWVVGVGAVLALELHEAADRQPVERVERLALVPQDLRARWEADPELEDADVRKARAVKKWPSSWMTTRAPRMKMNRTIVMIDCRKPVTQVLRSGWW